MNRPGAHICEVRSADDSSTVLTRIKFALAILLGLAVLVPGAAIGAPGAVAHRWVVYSGREDGLRIVFELNGRRLTPAIVSIPIACTGGPRPHRHFVEYTNRHFPIRVDRDGRFHDHTERLEQNGSESKTIAGRVTPKEIEGKISLSFSGRARVGNEECHSGKHPHGPMEELSFRAYRNRSG
jgi:hypothetical protein